MFSKAYGPWVVTGTAGRTRWAKGVFCHRRATELRDAGITNASAAMTSTTIAAITQPRRRLGGRTTGPPALAYVLATLAVLPCTQRSVAERTSGRRPRRGALPASTR